MLNDQSNPEGSPVRFELRGSVSRRSLEAWEEAIRSRARRETLRICTLCAATHVQYRKRWFGESEKPFYQGKLLRWAMLVSVELPCSLCGCQVVSFFELLDE